MIEILKYSDISDANSFKNSLLNDISEDWSGEAALCPPQFAFFSSSESLVFVMRLALPVDGHPEAMAHEFREELWRYELGEFFLADPQSGKYMEFNLAPNGAWWSCFFEAPRMPITPNEQLAGVVTECWTDEAAGESGVVSVAATIPRSSLRRGGMEFLQEGALLNATFILGSEEKGGQRFFTAAPLPGAEPNFHQPAHFLPIRMEGEVR